MTDLTHLDALKQEMVHVGRRLYERDLLGACEGNLSVRIDAEHLLCTPSGVCKGELDPDSLVVITLDGTPVSSGRPSSEIKLHLVCYAERPDCQPLSTAHPPVATAFAVADREIPDNYLPEAAIVLGSVASVPFALTGTMEVPQSIRPYLSDHKTFLLANHGACTLGSGLRDALYRMETLERIARCLMYAELLGGAKPMPAAAFSTLLGSALNGRLTPSTDNE